MHPGDHLILACLEAHSSRTVRECLCSPNALHFPLLSRALRSKHTVHAGGSVLHSSWFGRINTSPPPVCLFPLLISALPQLANLPLLFIQPSTYSTGRTQKQTEGKKSRVMLHSEGWLCNAFCEQGGHRPGKQAWRRGRRGPHSVTEPIRVCERAAQF